MHELSVARGILEIVESECHRRGLGRVLAVRLRLGALSGVDPEALAVAFEAAREGTRASGARLEMDVEQGRLVCQACLAETAADLRPAACPACGSEQLRYHGGTELDVVSLEVDEDG